MSLSSSSFGSEIAIWERVIHPERGDLPPEAAQFFLNLDFGQSDLKLMQELVVKNQEGSLNAEDAETLRNYRQIGLQIDLLRSKARQAIRNHTSAP